MEIAVRLKKYLAFVPLTSQCRHWYGYTFSNWPCLTLWSCCRGDSCAAVSKVFGCSHALLGLEARLQQRTMRSREWHAGGRQGSFEFPVCDLKELCLRWNPVTEALSSSLKSCFISKMPLPNAQWLPWKRILKRCPYSSLWVLSGYEFNNGCRCLTVSVPKAFLRVEISSDLKNQFYSFLATCFFPCREVLPVLTCIC